MGKSKKDVRLEIIYLPVESLEEYEGNARDHGEEDVNAIKRSIEKFGFDDPIGIWSDHNVIVEVWWNKFRKVPGFNRPVCYENTIVRTWFIIACGQFSEVRIAQNYTERAHAFGQYFFTMGSK